MDQVSEYLCHVMEAEGFRINASGNAWQSAGLRVSTPETLACCIWGFLFVCLLACFVLFFRIRLLLPRQELIQTPFLPGGEGSQHLTRKSALKHSVRFTPQLQVSLITLILLMPQALTH